MTKENLECNWQKMKTYWAQVSAFIWGYLVMVRVAKYVYFSILIVFEDGWWSRLRRPAPL